MRTLLFLLLTFMTLHQLPAQALVELQFVTAPDLPNTEGYAGAIAGVIDDALIVAGGANFPDRKPWENGIKRWYSDVYRLNEAQATWEVIGQLPQPLGYSACASDQGSLYVAGGSNETGHFADTFRLSVASGKLQVDPLPSLPAATANHASVLVGRKWYVVPGLPDPTAVACTGGFWCLDLDHIDRGWQTLEPCPGPARMLCGMACIDDSVYLVGGASLKRGDDGKAEREYLKDVWQYQPNQGWTRRHDLPTPRAAMPTPLPCWNNSLLVLSGDDGSRIGFQPIAEHPGFPRDELWYDAANDQWRQLANPLELTLATPPTVLWRGDWWVINGEIRPGVRTPKVWKLMRRQVLVGKIAKLFSPAFWANPATMKGPA